MADNGAGNGSHIATREGEQRIPLKEFVRDVVDLPIENHEAPDDGGGPKPPLRPSSPPPTRLGTARERARFIQRYKRLRPK
jgi:hypothetical protein